MKIEELSIESIFPYEANPRNNDQAVAGVAESIKEFGFQQPIVIDSNNVIVAGHTRYKAALRLGIKSVPCVKADQLTPDQVKAYRILDNKLNEKSTWDFDLLKAEIPDLDVDFGAFNVSFGDVSLDVPELDEGLVFKHKESQSAPATGTPIPPFPFPTQGGEPITPTETSDQQVVSNPFIPDEGISGNNESSQSTGTTPNWRETTWNQNQGGTPGYQNNTEGEWIENESQVANEAPPSAYPPDYVPDAIPMPSDIDQFKDAEGESEEKEDASFGILFYRDLEIPISASEKKQFIERYEEYVQHFQSAEGFIASLL